MNGERGYALLEALAALGLAALCVTALALAARGAARVQTQTGGPNRRAALAFARQTLRVAQDAWKYGSPGAAPAGSATALIPFPARVSATVEPDGEDAATISVRVEYSPDPATNDSGVVTLEGAVHAMAPLPGSRVEAAAVAQP